ncbi:MAG: hypothetical protein HYY13_13370 [Nitrospirae bacterium]|nr:hypothetical protein [Nitrospirota bacterium]
MGTVTALRLVQTDEVSWPAEVVSLGARTAAAETGWQQHAASPLELGLPPAVERGPEAVRAVRSYDLVISPRWSQHSRYMVTQLASRRRGGMLLAGLSLIAVAAWAGAQLL